MSVDIETEFVQLWAASRTVADTLTRVLPKRSENLTISTIGLRSGRDHRIAGLAQILNIAQAFTLELAIKSLYRSLNPHNNPENTHDLSRLFNSLHKDVKARLRANWKETPGRSQLAKDLTLDEFLATYRSLFDGSRYLYEKTRSYSVNTKDFDLAIWVITAELTKRQPNDILLRNVFNVVSPNQEE